MLLKYLKGFIKSRAEPQKPLVFGYSGGVDSQALLHLLLRCKETQLLDLHVVHVDHKWREESSEEAAFLKNTVESLGVSFYLETIEGIDSKFSQNLEEIYREKRLSIFQKIYKKIGAQALILAHQKNDQAETVFKRIFEGAPLIKLKGLREISTVKEMVIWRPLLGFSKQELYCFLQKESLSFIEDRTNKDLHYLRGRQREEIFPVIEEKFGKKSLDNLCKIAEKMAQYEQYFDRKIEVYNEKMIKGSFGFYIDLYALPQQLLEDLVLEHFIRRACEKYRERISHQALETLLLKIKEKASNKKLTLKCLDIVIDRGVLFFIKQETSLSERDFLSQVALNLKNDRKKNFRSLKSETLISS